MSETVRVWPLSHDRVYKGDAPYLYDESRWILQHANATLPVVYSATKSSYEMERLIKPPWTIMDHRQVLIQLYYNMNKIWSQEPEHPFDQHALDHHLSLILKDEPVPPLAKIAQEIDWSKVRTGLVHGNAYLHNVMFREQNENIVLISPKPLTLVMPDMPCLDLGMMLLSILGYGGTWTLQPFKLEDLINDDNEWAATIFWSVVHLINMLPDAPSENAKNKIWQLITKAGELI